MELDSRKEEILKAIVEDYIMSAEPVGSKAIVERHKFSYSPATIRNEMKVLEKDGYLSQPHISSGRIPSTKGYRYYVDNLMKEQKLSMVEIDYINNSINGFGNVEGLLSEASKIVSKVLQVPTVCQINNEEVLDSMKLVNIADRIILVVLISKNGTVKDCVVKINESLSEEIINQLNTVLNQNLKGTPFENICDVLHKLIEREVETVANVMSDITNTIKNEVLSKEKIKVNDSLSALLTLPEFEDIEKARNFVNLLATKEVLNTTLSKIPEKNLSIIIGNETDEMLFKDYTIVSLDVKSQDKSLGKIGVIAPKRLDYSKTISTLKYIDKKIKDILKK